MHFATPCKIATTADKNCGNESKNRATKEIGKVIFLQHPLYIICFFIPNQYFWDHSKGCPILNSPGQFISYSAVKVNSLSSKYVKN